MLAHWMLLLEGILARLWTAVLIIVSALARSRLVVALALTLAAFGLLLRIRLLLVRSHDYVLQINVVVHVVEGRLGLVCRLVELSQHVEFVVDVLGRVPLRMQEHGVRVHLRVGRLLCNLHFHVGGYEIVAALPAVPLRSRRVRGKVLVVIHGSTTLAVVLLLLESLLHERVLVLRVWTLRIRLNKIAVELLDTVASFCFLLHVHLIVVSALIARVAAQATVLVRRVPDIFFILIFNYDLLE